MSYFIPRGDISGVSDANKANAAMQFQEGQINSGMPEEEKWHNMLMGGIAPYGLHHDNV